MSLIRRLLPLHISLTFVTLATIAFARGQGRSISSSQSVSYEFMGPDSANWREIQQMDISWRHEFPMRIAVATGTGIAAQFGAGWVYPLRNGQTLDFYPNDNRYESVFFSPWNDSVAFVGRDIQNLLSGEPTSVGAQVPNIYSSSWMLRDFGGAFPLTSPSAFVFPPNNTGMVLASATLLCRSTDNGTSWTCGADPWGPLAMAADRAGDSVFYVLVSSGLTVTLLRSTDNTQSWAPVSEIAVPFGARTTLLADGELLILSVSLTTFPPDSACGVYRSTDHGETWVQVLSALNVEDVSIDPDSGQRYFAVAPSLLLISHNHGEAWVPVNVPIPSSRFTSIRKASGFDTLYIATSDVGIYRVFDIPLHAKEPDELPRSTDLLQNYPNPFNASTAIGYSLPRSQHVQIAVFDIHGRQVTTLVDGELQAGTHTVTWDAGRFASGVYFYTLQAEATVRCKSMILLK